MSNPHSFPGHPAYGQPPMSYPGQYSSAAPGQYPPNPAKGYNEQYPAPYAHPQQAYPPSGCPYGGLVPPYGAPVAYPQPPQPYSYPYPPSQQPYYFPPHSEQTNRVPVVAPIRPTFQDWHPNAAQLQQIELWFQEVDPERSGFARGETIVPLFMKSYLHKDILIELWRLVDWNGRGSLDREQFTIAIRFLCIMCNPSYAGSKPTVDLFNSAISKDLSIPLQMLQQEEPVSLAVPQQLSSSLPSPIHISNQPQYSPTYSVESTANASFAPHSSVGPSYQHHSYQPSSPLLLHQQKQPVPALQPQQIVVRTSAVVADDEEEEFSDFAGASYEPSTQLQTEESEASWDFVSASTNAAVTAVQEPISAISNISSSMDFDLLGSPPPIKDEKKAIELEEEEEEFGEADFQQATPPAQVAVLISADLPVNNAANEQVQRQPVVPSQQPPAPPMSMASMQSASKLSAFDELIGQDLMIAAVEGEDWDDFAGPVEVEVQEAPVYSQPASVPAVSNSDNPFDDFEDNIDQASLPVAVKDASLLFDNAPSIETAVAEEGDDEFGDFESNHSPLPDSTTSQPPMLQPPVMQSAQVQQDDLKISVEEDEFGDFETHTDSPLPNNHHDKSGSSQTIAPAMIEDLLDLLSDPVSMTDHIANNGGLGLSFSKQSSADFLDLLSSPVEEPVAVLPPPSAAAVALAVLPQQETVEELEDESFDDFNSAVASFPPPTVVSPAVVSAPVESVNDEVDFDAEFEPFQSYSSPPPPTSKETVQDTISLPSPIDQARPKAMPIPVVTEELPVTAPRCASNPDAKPLSRKELEALVVQLENKNLYDEAYACARQITLLKQMQELIELKNTALEKDDMEAVMKIKKQTTDLLPLIEEQDEEQLWKEAAADKKRQGQRVEDMYENLNWFDDALASKFKAKYMSPTTMPTKSASIESRMLFYSLAKRSSRVLLAISSSHRNHPTMWKQLKDCILPLLAEQQKIISDFKQLSMKEQAFVKASTKFQGYLLYLVAVLEGGIWLAATCQDALVLENESNQLYESCQNLLAIVVKDCGASSQLMGKTMEELSLQAGKVSERSGVTYCNLTLRPLSTTASTTGVKKDLCPYIGKKQGVHYQLALMNLWLQNIASTFPSSDGEFA